MLLLSVRVAISWAYYISRGVKPDPIKIKAILEIGPPTNRKDLRSFLGMASYYRKFIRNFARIAVSLHQLTHDDVPYEWREEHDLAFSQLKNFLTNAPILSHPDFSQPFIIQTDACDSCLGGVLCQRMEGEERAIQYISRTLSPNEKKWSVREKEALGIIWSIETFRPYVIGSHFTVETDHESLQWLVNAKAPARLVRWSLRLSEFDFTIKY